MRIEFGQFTRFDQIELAAMAMEITAGIVGHCLFNDLSLDEGQLLNEILENPEDFNLENEVEHYREEDFAGRQLAREKFGNRVSEILEVRQRLLKLSHPFQLELGNEPTLFRQEVQSISPVYFATFSLTLFLLLEDQEITQIVEQDQEDFKTKFAKIFELISAYALSAQVEGIVWWTGHSGGRATFLQQLDALVNLVGSGVVRSENQLEANQIRVRDGGVDAIGLSTHEGAVQPDATCFLLGATRQSGNRKDKIVGQDAINRFRRFFINEPTVVFQGIFSIPYSATDAEAEDCRDRNCIYFPRAVIERNLGIASTKEYEHGTLQYVQTLRENMQKKILLAAGNFEIEKAGTIHSAHELLS